MIKTVETWGQRHTRMYREKGCKTVADYWIKAGVGKWRTCRRKIQNCDYKNCNNKIKIGDRYLDTGELKSVWATYHYCERCANKELIFT